MISLLERPVNTDLIFELLETQSKTHGCEGYIVYGIRVIRLGECSEMKEIEDISINKRNIQRLILKLKHGRVTPDQVYYIVEDFIIELTMDL